MSNFKTKIEGESSSSDDDSKDNNSSEDEEEDTLTSAASSGRRKSGTPNSTPKTTKKQSTTKKTPKNSTNSPPHGPPPPLPITTTTATTSDDDDEEDDGKTPLISKKGISPAKRESTRSKTALAEKQRLEEEELKKNKEEAEKLRIQQELEEAEIQKKKDEDEFLARTTEEQRLKDLAEQQRLDDEALQKALYDLDVAAKLRKDTEEIEAKEAAVKRQKETDEALALLNQQQQTAAEAEALRLKNEQDSQRLKDEYERLVREEEALKKAEIELDAKKERDRLSKEETEKRKKEEMERQKKEESNRLRKLKLFRVLVVGEKGAGKRSLVNRYLDPTTFTSHNDKLLSKGYVKKEVKTASSAGDTLLAKIYITDDIHDLDADFVKSVDCFIIVFDEGCTLDELDSIKTLIDDIVSLNPHVDLVTQVSIVSNKSDLDPLNPPPGGYTFQVLEDKIAAWYTTNQARIDNDQEYRDILTHVSTRTLTRFLEVRRTSAKEGQFVKYVLNTCIETAALHFYPISNVLTIGGGSSGSSGFTGGTLPTLIKVKNQITKIRLVLIGDSTVYDKFGDVETEGVGKTTITNQFVSQSDSNLPLGGPYTLYTMNQLDKSVIDIEIYHRSKAELSSNVYSKADGYMLMFDVRNKDTFKHLINNADLTIAQNEDYENPDRLKAYVLVGNKTDGYMGARQVDRDTVEEWAIKNGSMPYFETSAKNGNGVETAFRQLIQDTVDSLEAFNLISSTPSSSSSSSSSTSSSSNLSTPTPPSTSSGLTPREQLDLAEALRFAQSNPTYINPNSISYSPTTYKNGSSGTPTYVPDPYLYNNTSDSDDDNEDDYNNNNNNSSKNKQIAEDAALAYQLQKQLEDEEAARRFSTLNRNNGLYTTGDNGGFFNSAINSMITTLSKAVDDDSEAEEEEDKPVVFSYQPTPSSYSHHIDSTPSRSIYTKAKEDTDEEEEDKPVVFSYQPTPSTSYSHHIDSTPNQPRSAPKYDTDNEEEEDTPVVFSYQPTPSSQSYHIGSTPSKLTSAPKYDNDEEEEDAPVLFSYQPTPSTQAYHIGRTQSKPRVKPTTYDDEEEEEEEEDKPVVFSYQPTPSTHTSSYYNVKGNSPSPHKHYSSTPLHTTQLPSEFTPTYITRKQLLLARKLGNFGGRRPGEKSVIRYASGINIIIKTLDKNQKKTTKDVVKKGGQQHDNHQYKRDMCLIMAYANSQSLEITMKTMCGQSTLDIPYEWTKRIADMIDTSIVNSTNAIGGYDIQRDPKEKPLMKSFGELVMIVMGRRLEILHRVNILTDAVLVNPRPSKYKQLNFSVRDLTTTLTAGGVYAPWQWDVIYASWLNYCSTLFKRSTEYILLIENIPDTPTNDKLVNAEWHPSVIGGPWLQMIGSLCSEIVISTSHIDTVTNNELLMTNVHDTLSKFGGATVPYFPQFDSHLTNKLRIFLAMQLGLLYNNMPSGSFEVTEYSKVFKHVVTSACVWFGKTWGPLYNHIHIAASSAAGGSGVSVKRNKNLTDMARQLFDNLLMIPLMALVPSESSARVQTSSEIATQRVKHVYHNMFGSTATAAGGSPSLFRGDVNGLPHIFTLDTKFPHGGSIIENGTLQKEMIDYEQVLESLEAVFTTMLPYIKDTLPLSSTPLNNIKVASPAILSILSSHIKPTHNGLNWDSSFAVLQNDIVDVKKREGTKSRDLYAPIKDHVDIVEHATRYIAMANGSHAYTQTDEQSDMNELKQQHTTSTVYGSHTFAWLLFSLPQSVLLETVPVSGGPTIIDYLMKEVRVATKSTTPTELADKLAELFGLPEDWHTTPIMSTIEFVYPMLSFLFILAVYKKIIPSMSPYNLTNSHSNMINELRNLPMKRPVIVIPTPNTSLSSCKATSNDTHHHPHIEAILDNAKDLVEIIKVDNDDNSPSDLLKKLQKALMTVDNDSATSTISQLRAIPVSNMSEANRTEIYALREYLHDKSCKIEGKIILYHDMTALVDSLNEGDSSSSSITITDVIKPINTTRSSSHKTKISTNRRNTINVSAWLKE